MVLHSRLGGLLYDTQADLDFCKPRLCIVDASRLRVRLLRRWALMHIPMLRIPYRAHGACERCLHCDCMAERYRIDLGDVHGERANRQQCSDRQ